MVLDYIALGLLFFVAADETGSTLTKRAVSRPSSSDGWSSCRMAPLMSSAAAVVVNSISRYARLLGARTGPPVLYQCPCHCCAATYAERRAPAMRLNDAARAAPTGKA